MSHLISANNFLRFYVHIILLRTGPDTTMVVIAAQGLASYATASEAFDQPSTSPYNGRSNLNVISIELVMYMQLVGLTNTAYLQLQQVTILS